MIWDLKQYSNIDYANIHHGHELIATVAAPSFVVIQKEYQPLVLLNVTESWLIEMTLKNITYKENGIYTCTVGFTSRMKKIKLRKYITVTDLDDAISLYTSVDTGCSVVNCLSKYNVTLLGPGGKKTKNGTCLSEMENGIYSCCLLNQTVCQNEDCKYINVSTEYHTYTNTVGKTESTSPSITMNGEVDNHNTEVTIVIIVLVVVILVVFVLGAIILNRKKICKNSKRGAEKPTEENGHMLSEDAILTFTAYEGTEICLNFEQNVTDENSVIKVNNKDNLPIIVWIGKNNDWQLHLYEQYKNRIRTNDSPFNTLEFCFLNVSRDDAGIFYWNSENITLNVWYGPKDILLSPELQLISVLDEHSSLKINCSADCNPECQISWWKESKKLSFPVSNGLVLTDVSITDSGNYTCVAKNPEKNSSGIFKSLQIYVKYESEMDFTPNQVLEVKEHNDINVSCNYENYPLSNALWLRNGDRLDTTVKRKNEVVLHLFNNTCNNTGIYECSIFNNFGMKVTKLINLEVLCQPRFIGDTSKYTVTKKIEGTIGEKIIMNEKVQANPAPDLKFVSQDVDVSFLSLSNTLYSMFISILISSESNFRWYSVTIGNSEGNITLYIEVEKTRKLVYDYKFFIGISVSFFAFTFISTLIYKVIKRGIQNRGNQTESFSADYADAEVVLQEIHSLIDYDLEDANLYENRVREIELAATESYENLAIYGCTTPYEEMTNKKGMVKSDTSIERASTKAESSETECSMKIDEDGYLIITDMTAMESSKERFNSQPKELNISTKDDESYMKMNVPGTPIRHNTI